MHYQDISHEDYAKADLEVYQLIKNQGGIETYVFNGLSLEFFPNVFSPKYFTDSFWFAKEISEIVRGTSFLEIGSGTGVVSLLAAKNEASVFCTDINKQAISNTKRNFEINNLKGNFIEGDLFENIPKNICFDYIFWNHPFFESDMPVNDILLRAGFDHKYEDLERYLKEGHDYLNKNGKLLLGTGNAARLNRIEEICDKYFCKMNLLRTIVLPVSPANSLINDYRIYWIQNADYLEHK